MRYGPYYSPLIHPPGGASASSIPIDMDRNYIEEAMESGINAYLKRKEERRQRQLEDAQYAAQIAEMAGKYTPELQERVLAPTGEEPTIGERALGGLGRLIGMDTKLGQGRRPISVPTGGLQTKREREMLKSEQEQADKYNEFLRSLYKEQLKSDLAFQNKLAEKEHGIIVPRLTFAEQMALTKAKSKADSTGKITAKEQLAWDLYNGDVLPEELDDADLMIMGKYWSNMTPESRARDALKYAQGIVEAVEKGSLEALSDEERSLLVDQLADEFVNKQESLVERFKQVKGREGKGAGFKRQRTRGTAAEEKRPAIGDLLGVGGSVDKRKPLDEIFGGSKK